MLTRVGLALVELKLAPLPAVSRETVARELIYAVLTCSAIHAWAGLALIHVGQAAGIVVTPWALALERVDHIDALPSVCAWV